MDSTSSAREVADLLGVPASTVLRWCRQARIAAHKSRWGSWRVPRDAVDALIGAHGRVPASLTEGRSRSEMLVLTAMVRAPRGLPSARAVAAVTALSPTTASKVLDQLAMKGLVERREEHRLVRGRSRAMTIWYADLDAPRLRELLPILHQVRLPDPPASSLPDQLPDHLWHLFWNADPRQVNPRRDGAVIAHRAIVASDPEAIGWVVSHLPPAAIEEALGYRGTPADAVAWLRACRAKETSKETSDGVA